MGFRVLGSLHKNRGHPDIFVTVGQPRWLMVVMLVSLCIPFILLTFLYSLYKWLGLLYSKMYCVMHGLGSATCIQILIYTEILVESGLQRLIQAGFLSGPLKTNPNFQNHNPKCVLQVRHAHRTTAGTALGSKV